MSRSAVFSKIASGCVIFITALNLLVVVSAVNNNVRLMELLMFPLVGLIFVFFGNYMYSIKPNYFAGIRTPWALSDDENWRRTHRLGGSMWFTGGLIITIAGLILPANRIEWVFFPVIIIITLVPFLYSYNIYRKSGKQ